MEPVENHQRQRYPGQQSPREQAHEPQLAFLVDPTLRDERIEHPQADVAAQQVRDDLQCAIHNYVIIIKNTYIFLG